MLKAALLFSDIKTVHTSSGTEERLSFNAGKFVAGLLTISLGIAAGTVFAS